PPSASAAPDARRSPLRDGQGSEPSRQPASEPEPYGRSVLARIDAQWEIEDHWRLASRLAEELPSDQLFALLLEANGDLGSEAGPRPARIPLDRRSARVATLLRSLVAREAAESVATRLVEAWPEDAADELLRFV